MASRVTSNMAVMLTATMRSHSAGGMRSTGSVGSGNAGIVDEHVEPAERRDRLRHHGLDLGALCHIAAARDEARDLLAPSDGQPRVVDVADIDLGALRGEGAGKFPADAGRAGGDENALRHFCFLRDATLANPFVSAKAGTQIFWAKPGFRSAGTNGEWRSRLRRCRRILRVADREALG